MERVNKRYGVIYKITNMVNGKVYIGQTIRDFDSRYRGNIFKNTHNKHLKYAILKEGLENFKIEKEFKTAYSKEELDYLEDYYIKKYNATNPDFGYNKMFGGSNGLHTEEIKLKISKIQSEISGVSVICVTTNKAFPTVAKAAEYYNVSASNITLCCRKIISQTKGLQWLYYDDYIRGDVPLKIKDRRVICVTTGEVFDTANDILKIYPNVNLSGIVQCCKLLYASHGELKDGSRLQWLYYEDFLGGVKPKDIKDNRVICITTGRLFSSATEAGLFYGIDSTHIGSACKRHRGYCGTIGDGTKLQWLYYKDYLKGINVECLKDNRVICLNTLEVFKNASDASNKYRVEKSSINKCCKGTRKTCGRDKDNIPLRWMRYEDYLKTI